jgi:DNA polymerase I-like protein with 3'-5' exonuclease and polymerase domains
MTKILIKGELPTDLDPFSTYQLYNCLDAAITAQLLPELRSRLDEHTSITYGREMRVMGLCLEMSTKGLPINHFALAELDWALEKDQRRVLSVLHKFCAAIGFRPIKPNSTLDVPEFFYEHLKIPTIYEYDRSTKEKRVTADVKALEKIRANYPIAVPFCNAILAYREVTKLRSVFKRGLEPGTGRLRCNFSPSGTETGRLSSQQNPYGRGTNGQNLTDRIREVVEAPEGYSLVNLDLKTAESIAVGYISGCHSYIHACLSGDLHTGVSRLIWPELGWTGVLAEDKAIAEQLFYRHFSYRDMSKRGGHATNYYGQPPTVASHLKVPRDLIEKFQATYFTAFPEIYEWQLDVIARVMRDGYIVTRMGRKRRFWGRPDDAATHREAIAFDPQSLVADVMNEGLCQAQRFLLREYGHWPIDAGLLAQIHDAGLFLVPDSEVATVIPQLIKEATYPVDFGNLGEMVIPFDASVGKRWCKWKPKGNAVSGLRTYQLLPD